MPLKIEFFPDGLILLNEELATGLHPTLEKKLAKHPPDEWEIRLAEIASHCSVALDGIYPREQISELAAILSGRLQVMREFVAPQQIIGFDVKLTDPMKLAGIDSNFGDGDDDASNKS